MKETFGIEDIRFQLQQRQGYGQSPLIDKVMAHLGNAAPALEVSRLDDPPENAYYKGIQFKVIITVNDREWEIADGGFVDWTQQLMGNGKERMLIGGFGLEFLYRLKAGLV